MLFKIGDKNCTHVNVNEIESVCGGGAVHIFMKNRDPDNVEFYQVLDKSVQEVVDEINRIAGGGALKDVCDQLQKENIELSEQLREETQNGRDLFNLFFSAVQALHNIQSLANMSAFDGPRIAKRWIQENLTEEVMTQYDIEIKR